MSASEGGNGTNRAELLQRVELIETMIAEGRRTMTRCGWIFVLWGLVDFAGEGWDYFLPHSHFVQLWGWPICLFVGAVLTVLIGIAMNPGEGNKQSLQCRSLNAVWGMMGITMAIYIASAMMTHFAWQFSYVAALLMMLGMAHAISALILRWPVQGAVAVIWWAGGAAIFFFNSHRVTNLIFLLEMCFGMIAFGLYAMALERRGGAWGHS